MNNSENILLKPFDLAPFSKVKNEDYLPAFEELIKKTKEEIDAITSNSEAPTFENTIEALEYAGEQLDRVSSLFFNINSAETSAEIQKAARAEGMVTMKEDGYLKALTGQTTLEEVNRVAATDSA